MGEPVSLLEQVTGLKSGHRALARAQFAEVELLTGWFRRGAAADHVRSGGVLHSPDEGAAAAAEAAAVLRMSESAVNRSIDTGLALDELPCTRTAFAAGELDLDRVRVIIEITAPVSETARAELDRRMAERGLVCGPGGLRRAGRRWAHHLDPGSESERRRRAVEDRDVRVRATRSGMSILDGWLPVEAAQTVALRLAEMAQQVCADDPRTFPQRRADALVALADGSGRLVCRCERGEDCPRNGEPTSPPRAGLIQVGVSLETLLGLRDWPANLAGHGPIDADTARLLARDGRWEWIIAAIDAAAAGAATPRGDDTSDRATTTAVDDTAETSGTEAGDGVVDRLRVQDDEESAPTVGGVGHDVYETGTHSCGVRETGADSVYETGQTTDGGADAEVSAPPTEPEQVPDLPAEPTSERELPGEPDLPPDPESALRPAPEPAGGSGSGRRARAAAQRAVAAAAAWDDRDTVAALRYQWPDKLAKWLRARDGSCRFPNCGVPAQRCDIDHTIRFDHTDPRNGGRTIRSNGACLCRRHHAIKTAGENGHNGWRVRQLDHGRLEWTTPSGDVIVTEPDGAAALWPTDDIAPLPEPVPHEPVSRDWPIEIVGLSIADESLFAEIEANMPQHSSIEEWLGFVLDSYPPIHIETRSSPTDRPPKEDDDPPPF